MNMRNSSGAKAAEKVASHSEHLSMQKCLHI